MGVTAVRSPPTPSPFSSFPYERDSDSRSAKTVGPHFIFNWGFPGGSEGKEPVSNGEDLRSTPGSGRSPGEGEGHPHQYSCLGNPMDRGAWGARVHGVAKSFRMTEATQSSSIFSDGGTRDVSLSEPQVKFPPGETGLALPHGTSDSGPSSPSPATLQPRGQPCLQHP